MNGSQPSRWQRQCGFHFSQPRQLVFVNQVLRADFGRLESARPDPATHSFRISLGAASGLGYRQHT
jgi:hypothetical protein